MRRAARPRAIRALRTRTGWLAVTRIDGLPEIVDSASLHSPVLISETIVDSRGEPFPAGTRVVVWAYPNSEVIELMNVGDSIQAVPVAKALLGEGGSYAIRLKDAAGIQRFMSKARSVDFEIRAVDGDRYAAYSFSKSVRDLAGRPILVNDDVDENDKVALAGAAQRPDVAPIVSLPSNPAILHLSPGEAVVNKTDVCGETLVANLGSKAVVVGGTYTTASGASAKFTYVSGASSSLGVGYSTSGSYGTYSASGTWAKSSTSSIDFGTRSGSYLYKTYFQYGKYSQWCYPVYNPAAKTIYAYKVHASAFNGGSAVTASSAPSASYCFPFALGTSVSKSTTSAYTWSSGASLSSSIGVNLSSKTGYTTTAKLTYTNSSGGNKQICGTNRMWGNTPLRAVAKA